MKNNYQYGLIIGRFQPPSLHHLKFINKVIKSGIKKLLIAVGDSGTQNFRNFLTAKEVKTLIIPNLDNLNFPYELVIVPDINNPPKYADHIKKYFPQINETNTCLFTENDYTSDCFIHYGHNYQIFSPKIISVRATDIRHMIHDNNSDWQKFVPKNVAEYIIKNKIVYRLNSLQI